VDDVKPPLGVVPRKIWLRTRMVNLQQAIIRYAQAQQPIPVEWVAEYNDLLTVVDL